jgi:hypothetical protein
VGARAIVYAAKHPRRELFVGGPTLLAVWAQKFVPNILDWYLGRTGYEAQQTGEPRRERMDNLDVPLDAFADRGAHGRFERKARPWSPALELSIHRGAVMTMATATGLAILAAKLKGRASRG